MRALAHAVLAKRGHGFHSVFHRSGHSYHRYTHYTHGTSAGGSGGTGHWWHSLLLVGVIALAVVLVLVVRGRMRRS